MATILLRLAAPMQSWGDESKYNIRQTNLEPSKSGVIGLLAAALGLRRDSEEISTLNAALRMGVRVDMPGRVVVDFHTARAPKYSSKKEVRHYSDGSIMMEKSPYVTSRYYLCDACFLVGLESQDMQLLERISEALSSPYYPLYLGRRSCAPTLPLVLGIRDVELKEALENEPWLASEWYRRRARTSRLRMILEVSAGETPWHTFRDAPVSFSSVHRRYAPRGVEKEQYVILSHDEHDPMAEL